MWKQTNGQMYRNIGVLALVTATPNTPSLAAYTGLKSDTFRMNRTSGVVDTGMDLGVSGGFLKHSQERTSKYTQKGL